MIELLGFFAALLVASSTAPATQPATQPGLVGLWETRPMQTQLGQAVHRLEITSEGRFVQTSIMKSGMPPLEVRGTYRTDGDRLIFQMENRTSTSRFTLDGDTLTIKDRSGDVFEYIRRASTS